MPKNSKCKFRNYLNELWLSIFHYDLICELEIINHLVLKNDQSLTFCTKCPPKLFLFNWFPPLRFPLVILPKHTDELELTPESEDFSLEVHEFSLLDATVVLEVSPKCCLSSADLWFFLLYSGDKGVLLPLSAVKRGLGVGFNFFKSVVGTARWPPSWESSQLGSVLFSSVLLESSSGAIVRNIKKLSRQV